MKWERCLKRTLDGNRANPKTNTNTEKNKRKLKKELENVKINKESSNKMFCRGENIIPRFIVRQIT